MAGDFDAFHRLASSPQIDLAVEVTPSSDAGARRWPIVLAAVVAMSCLGSVYSWSLFARPLMAAFEWSNLGVSMIFAVNIFALGWGAVLGGRWQDRVGPRRVVVTGMVLWALGNLLAGVGTTRFGYWWLLGSYGIVGGFGNGIAYITPVATVTKWFPERRGLAGGLVVMGFGLGAVLYSGLVSNLPAFDGVARRAAAFVAARDAATQAGALFVAAPHLLSSDEIALVSSVFVASGAVFLLVGGLAASCLRNPPRVAPTPAGAGRAAQHSFAPAETLRTPQFYLLWSMLFVNVTAGILVISNALPIFSDLTGVGPAVAGAAYGALACFNVIGRFLWGWVSDRIGRNRAYVLIFGVQALVFCAMTRMSSLPGVAVAFAVVLTCYGGGFGTMPSYNADYFGTTHLGTNYGMILTAWGFAGLSGPLLAGYVKDRTGSFSRALLPVALMLLLATIVPLVIRRPRRRARHESSSPLDRLR